MLFHGKKNKKIVETIWTFIAIAVIVSMLLLYAPFFF